MSKVKKIINLKNSIEADIISQKLKELNIPHNVKSFHDTALDGLYQTQHGWGYIEAEEKYKEKIIKLYDEMKTAEFVEEDNKDSSEKDKSFEDEYKMVHNKKWRSILTIFALILFVFIFIFFIREYVKLKKEIKILKSDDSKIFNNIWNFDTGIVMSKWKGTDKTAIEKFDKNKTQYFEKIITYDKKGNKLAEILDINENGYYESEIIYNAGGTKIIEKIDVNDDGLIDKKIEYYDNETKIIWLDEDKNGFFDNCEVIHQDGRSKTINLKKNVFNIE